MRRLLAIPGFVLLAIGSILFYFGMRVGLHPTSPRPGPFTFLMAYFGFMVAMVGVFLMLVSGIFDGVLEKRWGPSAKIQKEESKKCASKLIRHYASLLSNRTSVHCTKAKERHVKRR